MAVDFLAVGVDRQARKAHPGTPALFQQATAEAGRLPLPADLLHQVFVGTAGAEAAVDEESLHR